MSEFRLRTAAALAAVAFGVGYAGSALAADMPTAEVEPDVAANDRVVSAFVAIGGGMAPEYAGSKHYKAIPFVVANLGWRGMELQIRGTEARLDVLGDSAWSFGPVVKYRGERDHDVKGPVRKLEKVDAAVEVGGFVGYKFGGDSNGQGAVSLTLTALQDVADGHDGFTVAAGVSYAALRWGPLYVNLDSDVTYGSKKFNRAYFGVTEAGAARSGLSAYRPDAGVRDVTAGLAVGYQLSEHWGVVARAAVTRYVGDAADSPIVKNGAKTGGLAGLGVTYRY